MRQEKQLLLEEIKEKIDTANAFIVMQYGKFSSNLSWELRKALRENNAEFEVVKKRIFQKAMLSSDISMDLDVQGNVGIVFLHGEIIDGTKAFCNFSKNQGDLFTIVSGRYEQKTYSRADVERLSTLPNESEMRAQLIALLQAPMTQTLSTMNALMTSVMHCIENKCKEPN
ncbi:MAG: 50S ribosomal protein L10 [Chlamydiota bacterium]